MKLDEAKKSKGKKDLEEMESMIGAMKKEGLSDEEIADVFTKLEDEALDTVIQKLKVEGYSDDEIVEYLKEEYESETSDKEEEEETTNPVDEIAMAALDKEPQKVAEYFDNAIKDRLTDMVGEYKTHIANTLFTDPPEESEEETEDETDRWDDNGGAPESYEDEVSEESEIEKAIGANTKTVRRKDQVKKGKGLGFKPQRNRPGRQKFTHLSKTTFDSKK